MKIVFVTDAVWPFNRGGKEKRLFDVCQHLLKVGHEVHVYTMKWWQNGNAYLDNGITLHAISPLIPLYSGRRRSIKEGIIFGISCLRLLFESWDVIDVDHMPFFPLFFVKFVCLLKRKKMIATWHEVWGKKYWQEYLGPLGQIAYLIEKISVYLPDRIISVSQLTTDKLKNDLLTKRKVFTIQDGIDFEYIKKIIPSTVESDIIFTGRLLQHKNVHLLIQSLVNLKMTYPKIKCLVIGDGPERSSLELLAKKLNLTENILFLGFVESHDEVLSLLKSSKVFVLPSVREGFGIALLEALACDIPVITTNHLDNAAKDLIKDGVNGFLAEPNSDDLSLQIKKTLASQKNLRPQNEVEKYDWSAIMKNLEQAFIFN